MMSTQSFASGPRMTDLGARASGEAGQRWLASLSLFLTIVLSVWGCEQAPQPDGKESRPSMEGLAEGLSIQTEPRGEGVVSRRDRPTIVAFGNSLTAGFGVAPEHAYPARLEDRLKRAGYSYDVVNAGVSGDTTAGGLRRLDWILRSDPELVILELGANDGLRGLNLEQTRTNLKQIIERLKASGTTVLLTGMKLPPNYGSDYTSRFESMYEELAADYKLPFYPFFLEGVAAKPSLNQADGIHPTGEGYRIIAENLFQTVKPLLANADHRSS